tara:strand:+ start:4828 stop:5043 length:216 start_codon:yes stop_codon:yes gene_type:complete
MWNEGSERLTILFAMGSKRDLYPKLGVEAQLVHVAKRAQQRHKKLAHHFSSVLGRKLPREFCVGIDCCFAS